VAHPFERKKISYHLVRKCSNFDQPEDSAWFHIRTTLFEIDFSATLFRIIFSLPENLVVPPCFVELLWRTGIKCEPFPQKLALVGKM
jgi:hypothetical protein